MHAYFPFKLFGDLGFLFRNINAAITSAGSARKAVPQSPLLPDIAIAKIANITASMITRLITLFIDTYFHYSLTGNCSTINVQPKLLDLPICLSKGSTTFGK